MAFYLNGPTMGIFRWNEVPELGDEYLLYMMMNVDRLVFTAVSESGNSFWAG